MRIMESCLGEGLPCVAGTAAGPIRRGRRSGGYRGDAAAV